MSRDLTAVMRPRGIAVVGASRRRSRGTLVLANLQRFGYTGRLFAVNPGYDSIGEIPCVPSVNDLPEDIDVVVVAVAADASLEVMRDVAAAGIPAAVMLASGFGDGGVGRHRREELEKLVESSGLLLVGPNCYGLADFSAGIAAYSGSIVDPLERGGVALIMQSGALTHSITDSALGRGLGLSALVTTGNEIGLGVADYIEWYADDPATSTIGVFLEGLRDVEAFSRACERARSAGKPVVVLATGKSARSRGAALAHTGAISGSGGALAGLLRSIGAVQVDDMDEFRETLLLFSAAGRPTSGGTALLSISGGGSGLLADLAEDVGLELPDFAPETITALSAVLPEFGVVSNPLDATGTAADDAELLHDVLVRAGQDPSVGAVCFVLNVGAAGEAQRDLYRRQATTLARFATSADAVPLAMSLTAGPVDPVVRATLDEAGVPLLSGARSSLAAIARWSSWHTSSARRPRLHTLPERQELPGDLGGRSSLTQLADAGVRVPRSALADTAERAGELAEEVGFPCVLKIESADIAHKTDVGGVRVGLSSRDEVVRATEEILAAASSQVPDAVIDGVLVQEMVAGPGLECLLGVVRDPQVGLTLSLAPGGVLVELIGEVPSWPLPLGAEEVAWLIDHGPLATLLDGYRGGPRYDRAALIENVVAFAGLVAAYGEQVEAVEVNPLIVLQEGRGAIAVDCLIVPRDRVDIG